MPTRDALVRDRTHAPWPLCLPSACFSVFFFLSCRLIDFCCSFLQFGAEQGEKAVSGAVGLIFLTCCSILSLTSHTTLIVLFWAPPSNSNFTPLIIHSCLLKYTYLVLQWLCNTCYYYWKIRVCDYSLFHVYKVSPHFHHLQLKSVHCLLKLLLNFYCFVHEDSALCVIEIC